MVHQRSSIPTYSLQVVKRVKAIQLAKGNFYDVKVSNIENGPSKFSIQLCDCLPHLEGMMKKINSQPHEHFSEQPIAGTMCLGLQTYPVNRLCRVILNAPKDTTCKAFFVDYGHHKTLSFDSIYQIPDEFVTENIFSIDFTLSEITDWKVSREMKEFFKNLVSDKSLRIRICEGPMSPWIQYGELYLQGQSVRDILLKNFPYACRKNLGTSSVGSLTSDLAPSVYDNYSDTSNNSHSIQQIYKTDNSDKFSELSTSNVEETPITSYAALNVPVGEVKKCIITHYPSPSSFYVLMLDNQELSNLTDEIATIYKYNGGQALPKTKILPGVACVARYAADRQWYRALVKSVDTTSATVQFVDYGNVETVSLSQIKEIEPRLMNIPAQAINCELLGCDTSDGQAPSNDPSKEWEVCFIIEANGRYRVTLQDQSSLELDALESMQDLPCSGENEEPIDLQSPYDDQDDNTVMIQKPTCFPVAPGQSFEVYVTWINSSKSTWLQRISDLPIEEQLRASMDEHYSSTEYKKITPIKNQLYAGLSNDGNWYRVEVMEISGDEVEIKLIDYGNIETISVEKLRSLAPEFSEPHRLGVEVSLSVSLEGSDQEQSDVLTPLLTDKVFTAFFYEHEPQQWVVDLIEDGEDLRHKLSSVNGKIETDTCDEEVVDNEAASQDVQEDTCLTFISNSTSVDDFWIQDEEWIEDLEMINEKLAESSELASVTKIRKGLVCIALFPEDGSYCRATVLSENEEGALVHYMDYGNTAVTNDLRIIPKDLAKIRPLAQKYRLAKPEGVVEWPKNINEIFGKFILENGNTIYTRQIVDEDTVRLVHEDKDVASELVKRCEETAENDAAEIQPADSRFAASEPVIITHVSSTSDFWIQKSVNCQESENLYEKLRGAESFVGVSEIKESMLVAAKFTEDDAWYRAKIVHDDEWSTRVLFVDYGNEVSIVDKVSNIRELPEELVDIPAMAQRCALKVNDMPYENEDDSKEPMLVSLELKGTNVLDILRNYTYVPIDSSSEDEFSDDSGVNSENNFVW